VGDPEGWLEGDEEGWPEGWPDGALVALAYAIKANNNKITAFILDKNRIIKTHKTRQDKRK
jgi:hypothetical protein